MRRLLWPFCSGLLWAWGYLVLFVSPSFFAGSPLAGIGFSEVPYLVSALCGYAVMAVACERPGRKIVLPASWVGCAAMVAGVALVALRHAVVPDSMGLLAVASVLAGAGLAACTTAWGVVLVGLDADALERTALSWCPSFGVVAIAAAFAAMLQEVAQPVIYFMLLALPLVAQAGLSRTDRMVASECAAAEQPGVQPRLGSALKLAGQDALTLLNLLVSFVSLSFIWSAVSSLRSGAFGVTVFVFAIAAVVLWAVLWFALRNTKRVGLSTLYAWALPLALLGVACASVGGVAMLTTAFVMVLVVDLGFEIIAKLSILYIGKRWPGHEGFAFALWMAVINVAGLLGPYLWGAAQQLAGQFGFATLMLFAFIPFVIAVVAASHGGSFFLRPQAEGEQPAEPEPATDPVQAFCENMEERYGLTPREAEVVRLLAQGRSRAFVRETLYISKGTVDTHAYHAYAKMGVKTKDELIKLVHQGEASA